MDPDLVNKLSEECILEFGTNGLVAGVSGASHLFFDESAELIGKKLAEVCEFFDYQSGSKLNDFQTYQKPIVVIHTDMGIMTAKMSVKEHAGKNYLILNKLDQVEKNIINKCEYENRQDLLDMLGKISHDFNNLLGVVMGHAELANYLSDNEEARNSHLKKVLDSTVKIKNLIKQILVYRHHLDDTPIEKFDLKSLIDHCVVNLRSNIKEDVSIKIKQVEPVFTCGSVSKMTDVFMNVLQNAVNAIDREGEVYIEIEAAENGYHKVLVKDNGIGMSQRTMEQMFEPFFSTQSRMKSAGVGLSIVKGILDRCGGQIEIQSNLNEGTEVRVSIPVLKDEAEKGLVLVVDDEKLVLGVTGEIVESLGYKVVCCEGLEEGEEALSNELFDIMLIDHHLCDGSGLDLIKYARSKGIDTPVILSCGHSHEDDFQEEGVDAYLMKPTSMKDIEAAFNSVMARRALKSR